MKRAVSPQSTDARRDIVRSFSGGAGAGAHKAEAFLRERGFSFAHAIKDDAGPRGVLFGQRAVAQWQRLSPDQRAALDGAITGDPVNGPVTITIYAGASAEARAAIERLGNQREVRVRA